MRRRLLLIAVSLIAVSVAAIAALPWWLGPVLERVGRSYGANFGAYERIGYTRFALRDVEVRQAGVRVTASRVEASTPLVWLWQRWTGRPGEILAERWTVTVESRNSSAGTTLPPSSGDGGWIPLRATLVRVAAGLDHWLPRAKIGGGAVRWPGGGLTLVSATWTGRTLAVEKLVFGPLKTAATLAFPLDADVLRLTLRTNDANGTAKLESHGANVTGNVTWWEQTAALSAQFGKHGWLPAAATLQADAWRVPGARLKLGELYTAVRAHGKIDWRDGHFSATRPCQESRRS